MKTEKVFVAKEFGMQCLYEIQGDALFKKIFPVLENQTKVILDFKNVNKLGIAFFNNSIGKLCRHFTKDYILSMIVFENMIDNDEWAVVIEKLIDNGIKYYSENPHLKVK